jgi:hypothetical protein
MKGKQLTLDEVLELKDGTKVWVESEYYENKGQISYVLLLEDFDYGFNRCRLSDGLDMSDEFYSQDIFENLEIFEWIDVGNNTAYNMSTEICNLRGIDLTDDNIDKIMKEFEVK